MLSTFHLLILKSLTKPLNAAQWKKVIAQLSVGEAALEQLYVSFNKLFPNLYTNAEFFLAESKARGIVQQCQKEGIQFIGYFDAAFPPRLKNIEQPPVLLFFKGDASLLLVEKSLAVIGTRTPSARGEKTAMKLSKRLAELGYVIISGLAVGCDAAAHRGCLAGQGKTIAILAHGLDSVYPKANTLLAKEIVEKGGCLLSEYPPQTIANPSYFIARDRLQSGLSEAVIIIESGAKSGTLHTARYAKKQDKPIACLNYPPELLAQDKTIDIAGNRQLWDEGAVSFLNKDELLLFLTEVSKKKTLQLLPTFLSLS